MKILWYELEDLRPTPSCSCVNPCTCSLSNYVHNYKNMEYIICFLKGLNANYSNVRTQILLMDPLPSISKVYSSVSQQGFNHSDDSTAVSINYTNPKNLSNQSKGRGKGPRTQLFAPIATKPIIPLITATWNMDFLQVINPKLILKPQKMIPTVLLPITEVTPNNQEPTVLSNKIMITIFPCPKKNTNIWLISSSHPIMSLLQKSNPHKTSRLTSFPTSTNLVIRYPPLLLGF